MAEMSARLDQAEGSLTPDDDVSCVVVERLNPHRIDYSI
jgi:hypothetical protein